MNRLLLAFLISVSVFASGESAGRDVELTASDGCRELFRDWRPRGINALTIDKRGFGESGV